MQAQIGLNGLEPRLPQPTCTSARLRLGDSPKAKALKSSS